MLSAAKTLWKLWTRLSRNYILKMIVKISRVPLDRFCSNLQGLCKKVLFTEPGEFLWKKNCSFIYKKLMKNGVKIFKKISNTCHLPKKKRFLAHCFDSSKTKISHLFWFKRDVLDNILTTARGLTENGLPANTI